MPFPSHVPYATQRTARSGPANNARTHARTSQPSAPAPPAPPRQQVLGDPFCQTAAALAAAGHGCVEAFDLHDLFSVDVNVCKPGLTMGSGGYLCVLAAAVLKRPAAAGTVVLQAARSLVQPWSVPPPWRTRINHKIQKRIAIKQDRSLRSNDRAAAEMARRPRTGRVPQLPKAFVL